MAEQAMQLQTEHKINAISAHALQNTELPEMQCIVKNMLYEGLAILAGPPKIGKSCDNMYLDYLQQNNIGCSKIAVT